jgi:probable rRNA maturation factor
MNWKKHLKNPNSFISKKINLINLKNPLYKRKILICSLLLSNAAQVKTLNKKFRNKNKTTDVLSFPFYKKKELKQKIRKEKEIYIGDIIINLSKIKNKKDKINFKIEFNKLWVHGLIHLFGYNHKKNSDHKIMSQVERKYLKYIS